VIKYELLVEMSVLLLCSFGSNGNETIWTSWTDRCYSINQLPARYWTAESAVYQCM